MLQLQENRENWEESMKSTYSLEVEPSDHAEVVPAASKSEVEVWIGFLIDAEDTTACEDNL